MPFQPLTEIIWEEPCSSSALTDMNLLNLRRHTRVQPHPWYRAAHMSTSLTNQKQNHSTEDQYQIDTWINHCALDFAKSPFPVGFFKTLYMTG